MSDKTISVEPMMIVKLERLTDNKFLLTAYGQDESVHDIAVGDTLTIIMPLIGDK